MHETSFFSQLKYEMLAGQFSFDRRAELATDHAVESRPATELHELVHAELVDNSTFGTLQKILYDCVHNEELDSDKRKHCREILKQSIAASWHVQEGIATYRAVVWTYFNLGHEATVKLRNALQTEYRDALKPLDFIFRGIGSDAHDKGLTAALHATFISLGMAALNVSIYPECQDLESLLNLPAGFMNQESPDTRFSQLLGDVDIIRGTLSKNFEEAAIIFEELRERNQHITGALIASLYEHALLRIQETAPFKILLNSERNLQIAQLMFSWRAILNDQQKVFSVPDGNLSVLQTGFLESKKVRRTTALDGIAVEEFVALCSEQAQFLLQLISHDAEGCEVIVHLVDLDPVPMDTGAWSLSALESLQARISLDTIDKSLGVFNRAETYTVVAGNQLAFIEDEAIKIPGCVIEYYSSPAELLDSLSDGISQKREKLEIGACMVNRANLEIDYGRQILYSAYDDSPMSEFVTSGPDQSNREFVVAFLDERIGYSQVTTAQLHVLKDEFADQWQPNIGLKVLPSNKGVVALMTIINQLIVET